MSAQPFTKADLERRHAAWQLVPKEPTEAMLRAGQQPMRMEWAYLTAESLLARYRAMLAAAPSPARELKMIDALHAGLQWIDNVGVLDKEELESYRDNVMEEMRAALR